MIIIVVAIKPLAPCPGFKSLSFPFFSFFSSKGDEWVRVYVKYWILDAVLMWKKTKTKTYAICGFEFGVGPANHNVSLSENLHLIAPAALKKKNDIRKICQRSHKKTLQKKINKWYLNRYVLILVLFFTLPFSSSFFIQFFFFFGVVSVFFFLFVIVLVFIHFFVFFLSFFLSFFFMIVLRRVCSYRAEANNRHRPTCRSVPRSEFVRWVQQVR